MIRGKGEVIVIVSDEDDNVFGGYMTPSFEHRKNFYGTGESFIFSFKGENLYAYKASLMNDLYCFSDEDGFGFGSDNHYGLFIDASLKKGFTFPCKTYNNDPLSPNTHFTIKKLEIWGFQSPDVHDYQHF
jgi:hypothetical protein